VHRRRIGLVLKLLVAVALFWWLFASGKIELAHFASIEEGWPWFAAAIVPYGAVLFLCAYRWQLLLRAQGIEYRLRDTWALTLIGHFFNQFLFGTTGGDMVKAYMVAAEQPGRRSAAVMSVFVDRVVGLLVLVLVALVAIAFNWEVIWHPDNASQLGFLAGLVAAVFAGSLVAGYLFYSERVRGLPGVRWLISKLPWREAISRLAEAVYIYKLHPRIVLGAVGTSIGVHLLVVSMNLCLALALTRETFPWTPFFFLIPLAQIAMAIPINPPGAAGTGEWIYSVLLPFAGVPQGSAVCLLQRLVYYVWAAFGCVHYLRRKARVEQAVHEAQAAEAHAAGGEDHDCPRDLGAADGAAERHRRLCARVDSSAVDA
jgi:hypothetical protein